MIETTEEIVNELEKNGFNISRLVCGSKSTYLSKYPDHVVFFNANIITKENGKVWHGDLNLYFDSLKLKQIASKFSTTFYVLREMDARFENENRPTEELIKASKWNTNQGVPLYDKEYNIIFANDEKVKEIEEEIEKRKEISIAVKKELNNITKKMKKAIKHYVFTDEKPKKIKKINSLIKSCCLNKKNVKKTKRLKK